jgi:hypothetical protein
VELVWHECEFRDGKSFTYAIYRSDLGCCYLYPMGVRRPLTGDLARHDVDVSWWVTPEAYRDGYFDKVCAALQTWLRGSLPFSSTVLFQRRDPATP